MDSWVLAWIAQLFYQLASKTDLYSVKAQRYTHTRIDTNQLQARPQFVPVCDPAHG